MAVPAFLLVDDAPVSRDLSGKGQAPNSFESKLEQVLAMPEIQRARIAQFCYPRVHMREMGLRIASTCSLQALKIAFGAGAQVVYNQSRDVEKTISSLDQKSGARSSTPITLASSRSFHSTTEAGED